MVFFFFQAEDGIRDLVRSRGLGDVYKRQRMLKANQEKEMDEHTFEHEYFHVAEDLRWNLIQGKLSAMHSIEAVSYTHLRAHETVLDLVCRLLLEKKNKNT